jgi:hypothetical protein
MSDEIRDGSSLAADVFSNLVTCRWSLVTAVMTPERFRQLEKLFESALEREPSQRVAFLQEACGGDASLQKQVEALVASHEQEPSFLESPTLKVTALLTEEDEVDLIVGQRIGPYQLLREIGHGGIHMTSFWPFP